MIKTGGALALAPAIQAASEHSRDLQAKVVSHNGVLKIELDGRIVEPLAFRSFRPEPRNISEFYNAGVRLMSILHTGLDCTLDVPYSRFGEVWIGPREYDFPAFDRQMELFLKHAPEAHFNLMFQLDTRDWYLRAHPQFSNSYWNLVEMAGHPKWREDTATALHDMLRYAEEKYGDRIFAYSLLCGSSTEWYTNSQGRGRPEAAIRHHPIKEACFRTFTGDPAATLLPLEELHHTSHGTFRDAKDAAALRYWKFHHEIIGDTILYFARRSQEVLRHRKLLGLYYGYLNQLDGKRLLEEGHLAYERVWSCPDIDMIFMPAKYGNTRAFEGASGYLGTVDSLGLHRKLMFQEIDHTTHIAPSTVENGRRIPGADSKLKDEFQTRMVLRREFVLTRVKRTGMWWFDFFGGYYYSEPLMREVAKMVRIQERLKDIPMRSVAEIAVFGDVQSMYHVSAQSPLAADLLVNPPDELARIGAPYDLYNLSDLIHVQLPLNRYKLIVFLNAFLIPSRIREFISEKLCGEGRTLLWLYAPNYLGSDRLSAAGISGITGIQVVRHNGEDSLVEITSEAMLARVPAGTRFGFNTKLSPLFEARDPEAEVLAKYVADGAPAVVAKRFQHHTSIYSAVGKVPAPVYREIARSAGIHIYYEGSEPVYINSRLLGIHMQAGVAPEISFPLRQRVRLRELFDGGEALAENGSCRLIHDAGATKLYHADTDLHPGAR